LNGRGLHVCLLCRCPERIPPAFRRHVMIVFPSTEGAI
jgi:hypothetical protein